jgi:uncharacterized membrane protein
MVVAALALGGVFLAAYLTLYHYGYLGSLACGTGGCATVQASPWAIWMGLPVALWGLGYYGSVFLVSTVGALGASSAKSWPTTALLSLNSWGVLFSGYLTWAEAVRIHAFCRYCLVSAGLTLVLFVLSALDWRARRVANPA